MNNMTTQSTLPTKKLFTTWLRAQPADRSFRYTDNERCLIASFLTESCGATDVNVGSNCYQLSVRDRTPICDFPAWMQRVSDRANAAGNLKNDSGTFQELDSFTVADFRKGYRP